MKTSIAVLLVVASLVEAGTAASEPVELVRIGLPSDASPIVQKAAEVFSRQVRQRCDAEVVIGGTERPTVRLSVEPGLGAEGFQITDGTEGTVHIRGNDERGVLYGVGKFLRGSRFDQGGFTPGAWRGQSVPVCPMRGMYLATHFANFYEAAPMEEVQQYVEDLALWGFNSISLAFPHWQFTGFDDPEARRMIARLKSIMRCAKSAGLKVSLGDAANGAFKSTPAELRNTPVPDPLGRHGNFGVNLCPAKPGAPKILLDDWRKLLDVFADPGLDGVGYWPYDEGGCGCPECSPWGARGYPKLCRELALATREKYPRLRHSVSTWTFDTPPAGEWEGLAKFLAANPGWADDILADSHEDFPRYPLEHGVPGNLPLINFPEISMWGQTPWGGYGANPLPARLQRLWNQAKAKLSGGFPYSEGIYEDLNKAICGQFYWSPDRPAADTVNEYIAFEYSPDVAEPVSSAIQLLEANHDRNQIGATALRARQLLQAADAKLTPAARRAWRWQILSLRGQIDAEMFQRGGKLIGPVLKQAFDELTRIYHAEGGHSMPIRPPSVAWYDQRGPDLSAAYAQAVLASKPLAYWRMQAGAGARRVKDAAHDHPLACEGDVTLPAGEDLQQAAPAAAFLDGRMKAELKELAGVYSLELWFWNGLPNNARAVTGYLFSRGPEGPEGTGADSLGISGAYSAPGRLFLFNGNALNQSVGGKTTLAPETWNHIVLVREGAKAKLYLNGASVPEFEGELQAGHPPGHRGIFLGGRNDNFANFSGKLAEAAIYNRVLDAGEIGRHYGAARPRAKPDVNPVFNKE